MHRLPSASTVTRFRLASFLYCSIYLIAASGIGVLGYSIWIDQHRLTLIGMGLIGLALLVTLIQRIISVRARCPLCLVAPLVGKACSKHRTARKLFGSHRLRVATSILFKGSFHCPFCGEPTAMEARQRVPRES